MNTISPVNNTTSFGMSVNSKILKLCNDMSDSVIDDVFSRHGTRKRFGVVIQAFQEFNATRSVDTLGKMMQYLDDQSNRFLTHVDLGVNSSGAPKILVTDIFDSGIVKKAFTPQVTDGKSPITPVKNLLSSFKKVKKYYEGLDSARKTLNKETTESAAKHVDAVKIEAIKKGTQIVNEMINTGTAEAHKLRAARRFTNYQ